MSITTLKRQTPNLHKMFIYDLFKSVSDLNCKWFVVVADVEKKTHWIKLDC